MQLTIPFANKYLAAAVLTAMLSAITAVPVFAEENLSKPAAGQTNPAAPAQSVPVQKNAANGTPGGQTAATGKDAATGQPATDQNKTAQNAVTVPDTGEEANGIDHSAEFKPIKNEFLKEGEGIPGSEIVYKSERELSRKEWKEIRGLEKDTRILQRKRQDFLKKRTKEKEQKEKSFSGAFKDRQEYSLIFNPDDYTTKTMNANGEKVTFRAYEHLVYVRKPYEPESQMLSVFIPEAYLKKDGTINGFTAETAPIFMPNSVGGYMPGTIVEPEEESPHGGANAALYALSNGYVVVSPAIRGRSLKGTNGYETGKAPALIVDYKAAVRFVRRNRKAKRLPAGDTEKIISSGTSAGGALSALLGATGNAKDYVPYLKAVGAARERDDIFASVVYCPVTNLENADMAYEWMYGVAGDNSKTAPANKPEPVASKTPAISGNASDNRPASAPGGIKKEIALTPEQKEISAELKEKFSEYLNSLNLRDSLDNRLNVTPDGEGLFREYIASLYLAAAQDAIDTGDKKVHKIPWLTISHGTAVHMDFAKYIKAVKRIKGVPAFDAFDMTTVENNEFGTPDIPNKHFTRYALEHSRFVTVPKEEEEKKLTEEKKRELSLALPVKKRQLQKANLEEQMEKDKLDISQYMADGQIIKMMNPVRYIGQPKVQTASNWRIRHGSLDRDTVLAIPAILAVKLKNNDKSVDFKVAWGYGHDGDYDLPELFAWTDRVSKLKDKTDAILKAEKEKEKEKEREKEEGESENNNKKKLAKTPESPVKASAEKEENAGSPVKKD